LFVTAAGKALQPDRTGPGNLGSSHGKAIQMSKMMSEIERRYPTHEEVELALARAKRMRAVAVRNAMFSTWAMLQRAVSRKPAKQALRHA
jgi:hypothetical protein